MSKHIKNVGVLFSLVLLLSLTSSAAVITINDAGGTTTTVETAQIEVVADPDGAAIFTSEDVQHLSKSGEPQIPWKMMRVLLPPDADIATVSCSIVSVKYKVIEGVWDVAPAPPILTRDADGNEIEIWPAGKAIVDGRDTDIYSADALWPSEDVQLMGTGELRSWKLAEIAVPLVLYNPLSGELRQLVHVEISVNCGKEDEVAKRSICARDPVTGKRRGYDRVKKLTVNFDDAAAVYEAAQGPAEGTQKDAPAGDDGRYPTGTNGYVIITTNAIRAASTKLADFVTHKTAMGFVVTVIDEDETGATVVGDAAATKLREWLQANYVAMDLKYALIIGDPTPANGYVPMKISCGTRYIPTDYHYAELTCDWDSDGDGIIGESGEIERFFEVYVGRIPYYGTIADTDAILQKTIDYETSTDTDWRYNTLVTAIPLDNNMHNYDWGEQIKADILEPSAVSSDRIYRDAYDQSPSMHDITPPAEYPPSAYPATVWSQGQYGLHVWVTHGSATSAQYIMQSSEAATLDDSHPSTVFQSSCQNAWPENTGNLSYSILKNGGIVAIGATRVSWYNNVHDFSDHPSIPGMSYRYAKGVVEGKSCGESLWDLKEETSSWWDHNWLLFNAYGDPSVVVLSDTPALTITPTDAFYSKQYEGETLILESRIYTLTNNTASALAWTAGKTASWFDLSSNGGTIPANSSITMNATLNSGIGSLPQGSYGDTITFTDTTHAKTLLRKVDFVQSQRVPRTEYEAEDATYVGPTFANSQPGYSGTGYLDYVNASDDYIEWTINTASNIGYCTLEFRYASATENRPLELKVDGVVVRSSLSFPSTGSWSSWGHTEEVIVPLAAAGTHTVRLTAIGSSGGNVDLLRVYDGLTFDYENADATTQGKTFADDNFGDEDCITMTTSDYSIAESYLRLIYADTTAPISSANLILTPKYKQASYPDAVITVRLLDDANDILWFEDTITWNTRPQGSGLEKTFIHSELELDVPFSLDVTDLLAQSMNSNRAASFQFSIDSAVWVTFHSKEATNPAVRPELQIITYKPADINMDDSVNLVDFAMLAEHWLDMDCSDATPCGRADIDGDNDVDIDDLRMLANDWLTP